MIKNLCLTSILSLTVLSGCNQSRPTQETDSSIQNETVFDAKLAWDEFEETLRFRYAYIDRTDFDVEAQLAHSKTLALATKNKKEFRRLLHKTSYAFTDPHFIVGPFEDDDYNIVPTSSDLQVEIQDGKIVVLDVRANSDAYKAGIRPNWVFTTIDEEDALAVVKKSNQDVIPNPTRKQLNYAANLVANGLRNGTRNFVLSNEGQEEIHVLANAREFARRVYDMPHLETKTVGNIGVVRINNTLGNNDMITEFDTAVDSLMHTDALIIDLRNTPSGGNTEVARSILGHFISTTRSYQVHEIPSLEREFTVPRRFIEQVKPRSPYYAKPIVVLGGHWTGSMGEGLVIGFDAVADPYIIASNMADLLGGLHNFDLEKSGARMDIGGEALFHVNGAPREDFTGDVILTAADTDIQGEDPAMLLAIAHLTK